MDGLQTELEANGVLVKECSWGYRLLVVDDLAGNQLFFNYPNEAANGKDRTLPEDSKTRAPA